MTDAGGYTVTFASYIEFPASFPDLTASGTDRLIAIVGSAGSSGVILVGGIDVS